MGSQLPEAKMHAGGMRDARRGWCKVQAAGYGGIKHLQSCYLNRVSPVDRKQIQSENTDISAAAAAATNQRRPVVFKVFAETVAVVGG